jgi:hypothetical protein
MARQRSWANGIKNIYSGTTIWSAGDTSKSVTLPEVDLNSVMLFIDGTDSVSSDWRGLTFEIYMGNSTTLNLHRRIGVGSYGRAQWHVIEFEKDLSQ